MTEDNDHANTIPFPSPNAPLPAPAPGAEAVANPAAEAPKGPSFAELGLHPEVLRAVEEMGFSHPMPVQATAFPLIADGRDLMVQSRTGSGKTAAFGIPFANGLVNPDEKFVQAIVLLPTRELALQVAAEMAKICAHRPLTVVPVYGGAPMGRQVEQLHGGAQIVCGTPGRIMDHMRRGTLRLDRVRCAVLDECDEMLSMGFQEDIEAILSKTPTERQTLLFSATVPEGIQRLSRRYLRNPEFLKLSADYVGVHEIKHLYYSIPAIHRENELLQILAFEEPKSAIIFCNTREETGRVAEFLRQHGHDAEAISSDLAQSDRERVLGRMRAGNIKFLVATDVAARGIDIEKLSHVFNYTFPEAPEIYIHRTGRTGRAGRQGTAVSLIGPTEVGSFYYLKLLYKIKPEERALPSEAEIRSHREGERVLVLRRALDGEPGAEWRALARRLTTAVDGERLIASLLAKSYASVEGMPAAPRPVVEVARPAPVENRDRDSERDRDRERDRPRGREDRPRFEGRDRPRDRSRPSDRERPRSFDRERDRDRERGGGERGSAERAGGERPGGERAGGERPSGERPAVERAGGERPGGERPAVERPAVERPAGERPAGERGGERLGAERGGAERAGTERAGTERGGAERGRSEERVGRRTERRGPPPLRNDQPPTEREFWEVWSEERAQSPSATDTSAAPAANPAGEAPAFDAPPASLGESPVSHRDDRDDRRSFDTSPTDVARLYLNLGRKDGASERDIRSLLESRAPGASVSEVDVMNTHTYLNVAPADAERITAAITGQELGGRQLVCESAKPRRR